MEKKVEKFIDRTVSWKKMLDGIIIRNSAARFETQANDTVKVTVQKKRPAWLVPPFSWIIRLRPAKSVMLDPIGMKICNWCDGRRTVEQIVELFAEDERLSFHEARVAVTGYIGSLVRYGILAVQIQS